MRDAKVFKWAQYKGAQERYSRDLSAPATQRGTTVSTIVGSVIGGSHCGKTLTTSGVTIDNEEVTDGIWYGRITGTTKGLIMIKLTVTFADGDVTYRYFSVDIEDPAND